MLETLLQPNDTAERCGIILKDGTAVELENIAEDPTKSFEINPEQLVPYLRDDVVASFWHTHPDSDPNLSGADYEGFLGWPELGHCIIGRRDGEVVVTRYRVEDGLVLACN